MANGLALSLSTNFCEERVREEAISPVEFVSVDVEGDGRGDRLTREAGSMRWSGSLTTLGTRSGSVGRSLVVRRGDGGRFPMCQGGPRRSPEIQSTLVWSSCWGATGSAGRSTQRGEQRRFVRARGNKGEVGVTRDQCRVW